MKNALGLVAALVITAVVASRPVEARDHWAPYGSEVVVAGPVVAEDPYLCTGVPVANLYDGIHFRKYIPAVHGGYAYRPYYRYSAYRAVPAAFACQGFYLRSDDRRLDRDRRLEEERRRWWWIFP
jgi:hypothetical protein